MGNLKNLPGLEVDVDSALDATKKKKLFFDLSAGQKVTLRFLPHFSKSAWKESGRIGAIFFKSAQHFRLKDEGDSKIFACLNQHTDEKCPVCQYVAAKIATMPDGSKAEKQAIDDFRFAMGASEQYHAQALVVVAKGAPVEGVSILRFTSAKANELAQMQKEEKEMLGTPPMAHPIEGQFIKYGVNEGQSKAKRYTVEATGIRADLSSLYPDWYEEMRDLGPQLLGLKIITRKEMLASLLETIGPQEFEKFFTKDGDPK